jgi:hypothetical protein
MNMDTYQKTGIGKKLKIAWYCLLIAGSVVGFIWGLTPATLIDTSFLTKTHDPELLKHKTFLIFITGVGFLSLALIPISFLAEIIYGTVSRKQARERIRSEFFMDGIAGISRDKFRSLCGLSNEEVTMLFDDTKSQFSYDDYLKARKYMETFTKGGMFRIN